MDTQMHAIHFKADQKLLTFIQERLNKLEQFNDQIVSAEVYLRLDNDREKENKITEIKLHVPGKDLFAKKQCKTGLHEPVHQSLYRSFGIVPCRECTN